MSMTATKTVSPQVHDEAIAALYHGLAKAKQARQSKAYSIMSMAGYRRRYFGREQAWSRQTTISGDDWNTERVTLEDALAKLENSDLDQRDLKAGKTPRQALAALVDADQYIHEIKDQINFAEKQYTGWSRFFLVTSSPGHIHDSMHCSSCRPTTSYGWLPELSGKSETEAVEAHGPALCSVCFSSAPTEMIGGKISKAQAERKAY